MSAFSGNVHGIVVICAAIVVIMMRGVAPKSVQIAADVFVFCLVLFWLARLLTGFYGPVMPVIRPFC